MVYYNPYDPQCRPYPCRPPFPYERRASAFRAGITEDQPASVSFFEKIRLPAIRFDLDGEYDPLTSTFIPKRDGIYLVGALMAFLPDNEIDNVAAVVITRDGGNTFLQFVNSLMWGIAVNHAEMSDILRLNKGDPVQLFGAASTPGSIVNAVFSAALFPYPPQAAYADEEAVPADDLLKNLFGK